MQPKNILNNVKKGGSILEKTGKIGIVIGAATGQPELIAGSTALIGVGSSARKVSKILKK